MNRRSNTTTSFITRLFVFVVTLALVGADLIVPAQNANSSTTMQNGNMSMPSNTSGTSMNRRSRRRRGRRRRGGMKMSNANAACGPMTENTNASEMQENANTGAMTGNMSMGGGRRRGRRRSGNMGAEATANANTTRVWTGRCDPNVQEQTDLSGTYTGTVNYTEGGLSGDSTLTITGNDFTLTSGSSTQEGRVVAVTTCGYTAVTMMFGKAQTTAPTGAQPAPLPAVSLRAKRTGKGISLMSVPGETKQFSFSSSGGGMGGGRRRRRGGRSAAAPAETSAPAETTETAAPTATPSGRRRRGSRRGNMNANTGTMNDNTSGGNMNMTTPGENTNMTGEPAGNMNTGGGRRRGGRRRGGNTNMNGNMNMSNNGNTSTPPR